MTTALQAKPGTYGRVKTRQADYTTPELMDALGVSSVTLSKWREGSPCRMPLPVVEGKRGGGSRIVFQRATLLGWLLTYRPDLRERIE